MALHDPRSGEAARYRELCEGGEMARGDPSPAARRKQRSKADRALDWWEGRDDRAWRAAADAVLDTILCHEAAAAVAKAIDDWEETDDSRPLRRVLDWVDEDTVGERSPARGPKDCNQAQVWWLARWQCTCKPCRTRRWNREIEERKRRDMRSTGTGVQRATVKATAMSTSARDRGDGGGGYNEATQTISSATSTPSSPPQSCSLDNDVDTGGSDSGHGGDSDSSSGGDGGSARAPNLASQGQREGDGGGTCMPTLADREDWDESSASQEEFGGWDEDWDEEHDWQFDYDWLDDWEERREETYREFAEQGQRKDAWGRL